MTRNASPDSDPELGVNTTFEIITDSNTVKRSFSIEKKMVESTVVTKL